MIHPCFKNNKESFLFGLLLLLMLFSPFVAHLIDRSFAYKSVAAVCGMSYDHIAKEVLCEKEDIDLLFLGSSEMWTGIDVNYLQKLWKTKHGRDFNVIMLGSNWRGMDRNLFLLKEILKTRKVRSVIMSCLSTSSFPYYGSKHLFNIFENHEDFKAAPKIWLAFYAQSILGVPRIIYERIKSAEVPKDLYHTTVNYIVHKNKGALMRDMGYNYHLTPSEGAKEFKRRHDKPPEFKSSEVVYRGGPSSFFSTPMPLNDFELYCYNSIVNLCKKHGIKLALIKVPLISYDNGDKVVFDQPVYDKNIPLIGLTLGMLFPGMTKDEIKDFYENNSHHNSNGARYFTESLADVFYDIYSGQSK